ncbi:tetratricopeptide repeat protein [Aromatoleum petrolei]|uniref:tetratricopeptide repeat protein n=1 Tax=Aromatoleum petrolei TaxID=76116 RepID=UPI001FD57883|nr:tetratricopeptide repeat protein [Aromatoleum petrolei]
MLLIAVTLAAYHGIEANSFHFDDWHNILLNPALQLDDFTLAGLLDAARGASLPHRPIASITFAIDWWRGGGDRAAHFLVTNLVLHGATGIAVFAFLLQTLGKANADHAPLRRIIAAGLAAAWWLAQPIHVQAVSYVVQRMTELAALFSVLSVWAYVQGRTARRGRTPWWGLSLLPLLSLMLGALSKQNAWISPALMLMAEFLVLRQHSDLVRSRLDKGLLALPVALGFLGLAALLVDGPFSEWILHGYAWRDFTLTERLLTQPKVVLFHFSQLMWPLPDRFSLDHDIEIVRSAASPQFWLPMGAVLAWTLSGIWLAFQRSTRLAAFFVLWVPVTLLIESTVVPLELVFEHRMYLPSVGVAGLIAFGLARTPGRTFLPACAAVAFATTFGIWSTQQRLPHWRSEISLLENSTRHAPNSVRVWNELGLKYLEQGNLELARQAIDRANQIEPRWGDGYPFVNRGVLLEAMGLRDQALAVYEETIRLFPNQVLGYNNRGLVHLRAGEFELAASDFDRAIETDPEYAPAWTNRGTTNYLRGKAAAALPDFEKAVRLSPRESIAWHYLARIYATHGRQADAAAARLRACRLGVARDCTE